MLFSLLLQRCHCLLQLQSFSDIFVMALGSRICEEVLEIVPPFGCGYHLTPRLALKQMVDVQCEQVTIPLV